MDQKFSTGLANTPTNVFKLTDGKGISWVWFSCPSAATVDHPKDNPILISYATLLANGYVCAWRNSMGTPESGIVPDMTSPMTPAEPSQALDQAERKELWLFHSDKMPQVQHLMSPRLKRIGCGTWKEGVPPDQVVYALLFKALRNVIERSLIGKSFYSLGHWFAKPEMDTSDRLCMMCNFTFFIHAHEVICASVDVRTMVGLVPLTLELLNQAMTSKSGMKVLLSPSGLSATLTGHSYSLSDDNVREMMEEWKLFYPKKHLSDHNYDMPAAVEVVIGGVRMKYPSHCVLVMGMSPDEGSLSSTSTCSKSAVGQLLSHWPSSDLAEGSRQSLRVEKVHLSEMRLPSKRSKEECGSVNTSKETAENLPHLKLAKIEYHAETPGYSAVMGHASWTRLGNNTVPKYATPLPSPSVSMPGSPATTQLPTPRVQVSTSPDESTTHTKYDYELATSQMKTDAMEWNSGLDGWWQCLNLPVASATPNEPTKEGCPPLVIPKLAAMPTVPKPAIGMVGTIHALPLPLATTTSSVPSLEEESCDPKQPIPPVPSSGTSGGQTDVETTGEIRAQNTDNYMSSDLLKVPMNLESIFDEDDVEQKQSVSGAASVKDTKKGGTSKDSLPDLQRMFPTPPSVEPLCTVEDKIDELHTDVAEGNSCKGDTTDVFYSDDEQHYTPVSFAPIQALPSKQLSVPQCCQYSPPYKNTAGVSTGNNSTVTTSSRVPSQDGDHLSTSVDHSQTQGKFQFPPSPSLMTSLEDKRVPPNKKRPESLSLSLSLRPPLSSGNGVTPLPSPALRSGRQSSFYHHLSSRTTTPRDSPAVVTSELPTPTPAVSNKLLPALPEAHALFLTLTLMHCLEPGEELSYSPYQIQTTGDSSGGSSPSGRCGLGFMEDSQDVYSEIDQAEWMGNLGATQTGYTSISGAKTMTSALNVPESLLKLVQDIGMQLTFCNVDLAALGVQSDPALLPSTSKYCMYPEKVFVSALCQSQFLIGHIRSQSYGPFGRQPTSFKPSTESITGEWVRTLQAVYGPTMIKHMRSIKNALVNLVDSSTLKVVADGPLNLRDMQQLASSQTVLGNECSPIPLPPLVVGYEHEWMSVSPLFLPHWDSMMFEPYSCKKDLLYMAFVPESHKLVSTTQAYFKEMSVTYESCNLGRHMPVSFKDVCDQGVIPVTMQLDSPDNHLPPFAAGMQRFFINTLVPALESLSEEPTDLLSALTNAEHTALASTMSTMYPLPSTHTQRLCGIVLYLVMDQKTLTDELCQTMKALDEVTLHRDIPEYIRRLLQPQILMVDSISGFHVQSYNEEEMKSQAYGVYSGCRVCPNLYSDVHSLTSFGPGADRHALVDPSHVSRYYAPLFVLTPEQLATAQPTMVLGGASWLLSSEEEVLFCAYCVSSSKKWLLATCSNKHGEILNTSVIEIHKANKSYFCSSRSLALQKLWRYCMSVVSGSVLRWSVVITRVGNPGWGEIAEWPDVIVNDGLLTANQHLKEQCTACQETSRHPELVNVVISSVQPDSTFRLLCTQDSLYSFSHGMVLPPNPAAANLLSPQEAEGDFVSIFSGVAAFSGSEDLDPSLMKSLEWDWPEANDPPASTVTHTVDQPLATGYLISPDTIGNMPEQFWEGGCQQHFGDASVLKLMLHWQFADIRHDSNSPQETLGSILLCLDGLAWLNADSATGRRRSCLPIHMRVLMNLFQLLHVIDASKQ